MTLLDRYLAGIFTRNLLLVLAALAGIYLLIDFIEKVDDFLEAGRGAYSCLRYLAFKVPLICEQLMPVAVLLAAVVSVALLSHNREILAMHACGITLARVIVPILACVAGVSLLTAAAAQWFTPAATALTNRIWHEEVKNEKARGTVIGGMTFHRGSHGIYAFRRTGDEDIFTSFSYAARGADNRLKIFLTARRARWDRGVWRLEDVLIERAGSEPVFLGKTALALPDEPAEFFRPPYHLEATPLMELFRQRTRDRAAALTLQKKLSFLALGLPLAFIGLPLLIIMIRRFNAGLAVAIPASCVLAFVAWGWWSVAIALAAGRGAPPALYAWSAHAVCLVLGAFLFARVRL